MIQSANKYLISDIFGIDSKVKFVIPKYQREYVWRKEDWDNLFNDLLENEEGHFLGSIICINKVSDTLGTLPLELVDGQQRLTTISILYAVIYKKLSQINREDDDFKTEKINLKHRLIQKHKKDETKIHLSFQNSNHQDYLAILKEVGIFENGEKLANLGNRRLYKSFSYFNELIEDFDYNKLTTLLSKINSALLVKIEVISHADAFTLFESLNNRGIPLSAIDLIKNNLLAELEKKNILSIDKAFNDWKTLIDNLTDDYALQERFLRQFYNAFRYKPEVKVNIKGGTKATRSNLINIFDKLIDRNPKLIFEELCKKASIYGPLIKIDFANNFSKELLDLSRIGASPSYTFLLYLLSEHSENKTLIKETIQFLIKYFVRRNLTDYPATRNLDAIFIGIVDECESNKKSLSIEVITKYLIHEDRFQKLTIFEEKLRGNIYEDNPDVCRFLLSCLEEDHFTREHKPNLWERDEKGKFIWTIEHIFPEGERIPKEWINMIAGGSEEKAKEIQKELVHKVGNLTLTGYNSQLSNLSFEKKRDRKDSKGNFIGYKNGLFLNKDLAKMEKWKEEDIKNRTDQIVSVLLNKFKMLSE
jgi:uncharacterized protein with ParB-like and HNH nuclease domain